ncbi:MAG: hypothetical protein KC636_22480, partial [Myxococcales bacterium]|nr:hypothetical protein [Myxococcales bacterium]
MSETERRFHEDWLGRVQPIEGLVLSVPVLTEARCMQRRGRAGQLRFAELCAPSPRDDRVHVIADLERLLFELLEFEREDFDAGDDLPADLRVYVEEGGQTLCPTLALRKAPQGDGDDAGDEAAADRYQLLVWAIPEHLDLDKQESETGPWRYTPAAKFARLLDRTGIPIGLLTNGRATRLVYSPRGQSLGAITFVTDHMLAIDGRPVLDAFWSLMAATRWFTVPTAQRLPALLQQSRERQQDVTNALAEQVFTALTLLLRGVTEAAERDGDAALRQALAEEERDLVYTGLLTVLLRMVFVLYAEDRGLLPVEHPIYEHLGLLPLFEQLQADHGDFPDTMHQRFGAWPRVLSLFRAIYFGARAGDFYLPPRHGELFSPHAFGFLEGWAGGAAPTTPEARARVAAPTVSDGTVHAVLDK